MNENIPNFTKFKNENENEKKFNAFCFFDSRVGSA
jgi:hypothetical protein